tara:strand:+ start:5594 stop:5830 length:237 start_codon:yes stop_codon:yes gene_type:complete
MVSILLRTPSCITTLAFGQWVDLIRFAVMGKVEDYYLPVWTPWDDSESGWIVLPVYKPSPIVPTWNGAGFTFTIIRSI